MSGVNKVIIIGNLGADPEMRYLPDGSPVATMSVATSESWVDKQTNERKEATEWHRIVIFGRTAEVAGEYLRKGSKAYFEGSLKTRQWEDQQGIARYTTEIKVSKLELLDKRAENAPDRQSNQPQRQPGKKPVAATQPPAHTQGGDFQGNFDDEIPF